MISRAGSRIFRRGGRGPILGGFWPPTWALFSENVCENERIGSCTGRVLARPLDPPMISIHFVKIKTIFLQNPKAASLGLLRNTLFPNDKIIKPLGLELVQPTGYFFPN